MVTPDVASQAKMVVVCQLCENMYTKSRNLKRHLNECHNSNAKLFTCVELNCAYSSKRRSNVVQHLERVHNYTKQASRTILIKAKGRVENVLSSGYYSNVTSDGLTDVSDDDDVLDMVRELDFLLDNLGNDIPEADDSFIDQLLEDTGNSAVNSAEDVLDDHGVKWSCNKSTASKKTKRLQTRRKGRLILPKLLRRMSASSLLTFALPSKLRRLATRTFIY